MRDWINEWKQDGRLHVWRYERPNRSWKGWHFTADPLGCSSIANLLDRMQGGEARYRTLRLEAVTEAVLAVPNYGHDIAGHLKKLRVEYKPDAEDLDLQADMDTLTMTIGPERLRKVVAAFRAVASGQGDFGIRTSDNRKAEPWMFWWMPYCRIENRTREST